MASANYHSFICVPCWKNIFSQKEVYQCFKNTWNKYNFSYTILAPDLLLRFTMLCIVAAVAVDFLSAKIFYNIWKVFKTKQCKRKTSERKMGEIQNEKMKRYNVKTQNLQQTEECKWQEKTNFVHKLWWIIMRNRGD